MLLQMHDRTDPQQSLEKTTTERTSRAAFYGFIAMFALLLTTASAVLGVWWGSERFLMDTTQADLKRLAAIAASTVNGDLHKGLTSPEQMDGLEYNSAIAPLRALHARSPEAKYVYTMVHDGESYRFVLDTAKPGDNDGDGVEDRSALWEIYEDPDPVMIDMFERPTDDVRPAVTTEPYSDQWGTFLTGYAPILDRRGQRVGIVGVDMPLLTYKDRIRHHGLMMLSGILPALFASILVGAIVWYLSHKNWQQWLDLIHTKNAIAELSVTDPLTKIHNRAKLDTDLRLAIERAVRYGHEFGVIMLDVDHFKSINDTHGHNVGDTVLIAVAELLQKHIRQVDTVGRWGGEEFMIICPGTDVDGLTILAENMREKFDEHQFPVVDKVTSSFGVATYRTDDTADKIVKRADMALYAAKGKGRNCVEAL